MRKIVLNQKKMKETAINKASESKNTKIVSTFIFPTGSIFILFTISRVNYTSESGKMDKNMALVIIIIHLSIFMKVNSDMIKRMVKEL